ncbi:hypothetical protein V1525DRAFT_426790 [Lipomyces kononenkoae]|uniref:Uncharacterized protein n=1 Tax=Lipomyces kononenkoae TaxID=34357 RepID=A0ACC3SYV9_LIPKO
MGPPRSPASLHVLSAGTVLLREDNTLHFLSATDLTPQRQPAAFDALSYVYPRPRDSSGFACVQTSPQLAVSVWQFIAEGDPADDLICVSERTVVCDDSQTDTDLLTVPCCWDMEGRKMIFGLPSSRLAVVDLSDPSSPPSLRFFSTPDSSQVKAIASSPHDQDVFAVACGSGRTFLCSLRSENNNETSDHLFVPDVLHTMPDISGRPAATLAFHPTSTDPASLMLAIIHSASPNIVPGLTENEPSQSEDEVQVWCINVGKSVHLIRRLHPGVSAADAERGSDRFLKWSKNGRVIQFIGNSLIIYDVRRNNGAQETIRTPEGTQIVAVDLHRDSGMAWVLDTTMQLHVYDLLHCTVLMSGQVNWDVNSRPSSGRVLQTMKSFTGSPARVQSSSLRDKEGGILRRTSSDLLSYYLNQSPDRGETPRETLPAKDIEEGDSENDDNNQPATAIGVSPIWALTEPALTMTTTQGQGQQQLLLPTEASLQSPQAPVDLELAMPQPILPDCLFTHLGELMQDSDTGLDFTSAAPSTPRTILEILFGWPPAYPGLSVRDLVAWELDRVLKSTSPSPPSAFVRTVLNIWLRDCVENNPVRCLELALTSLQAHASTANMTVSISWLVYAMHLAALQLETTVSREANNEKKQQMARIFTDTVLFRDKDAYGDDVEAVHLAAGILIGCGLSQEARDIYQANAYYLEATLLSLLFGLPVEEILRDWIDQAMDKGATKIALRW